MAVLSKTLIKKDVVHALGCKADDVLDDAKKEVHQAKAAKTAFLMAKTKIEALCEIVQEDLDAGKLDEVIQGGTLPLAEYIKRQIMRAGGVCESLATSAELQGLRAEGAVSAMEKMVEYTKKEHDAQLQILDKISQALDSDTADIDPETGEVSVRPQSASVSAAEDIANRKAEAKAAKEKAPAKKTTKNSKAKTKG